MKQLTPRQMERLILAHGWTVDRATGGSHRVYKKAGNPVHIVIAFHPGGMSPGVQHRIMRIAGITRDEL